MTLLPALILATVLTSKDAVLRLTAAELKVLIDKGEAVVVDVRGSVPFEIEHIAGAIWMPLGMMNQRAGELPEDSLIVTYCTCKAEESSLEAAMLLSRLGLQRVAVLTGGSAAWKEAGFPMESNREPVENASGEASVGAGRFLPPAAVACDRNQLTSHSGRVKTYKRGMDKTVLVMETSAGTVERLTLRHSGTDDPSKAYLIAGTPFTPTDWNRIERKRGELIEGMSAIAWVCEDGRTVIDWRPGTTFSGAE